MSRLRVRPTAPDADGRTLSVTPESAGWGHVGFALHRLTPGQSLSGHEADRELCLVLVSGAARIVAGTVDLGLTGGRESPFVDAAPGAAYIPAGVSCTVTAEGPVELAICSAPGRPGGDARLIASTQMGREVRGQGTNTRHVRNILPEGEPADSLLVVEVITPGGHWSSYPPHRHDTAREAETLLEETYYHRLNPPQGFAFQRVYTDDRSLDETVCVEDGDVVMVPRGYHPVGAPHGYDLYYLNVMAGPERRWRFHNDPAHEWIITGPR